MHWYLIVKGFVIGVVNCVLGCGLFLTAGQTIKLCFQISLVFSLASHQIVHCSLAA